jgi:hypothetical protein
LGSEAGSRLTARIAVNISPDTLLWRVNQLMDESASPPRVVGIDDWAWRKGQRYGTIIVDLERRDVIDLLADRDAKTVAAWLKALPESTWSAGTVPRRMHRQRRRVPIKPSRLRIAWHLLKNLRESIERVFERRSAVTDAALTGIESPLGGDPRLGGP